MKRLSVLLTSLFFIANSVALAWAGTNQPSLRYEIVNYSKYNIGWGYSQSSQYGSGPSTTQGYLKPGSPSNPTTADLTTTGYFYYSGKRAFKSRSCYGGNWRFTITSGVNTAPIDFTAEVPCSGSDNWVSVAGTGVELPEPMLTNLKGTHKNEGVMVCGYSSKYGVASKASAYSDSVYKISVYNITDLVSGVDQTASCPSD